MNKEIKEKQLNEVLYGLDYIGNKIKNDDGKLELGVNNCKLLDYITNLQEENEKLTKARYSLDRVELEQRIDRAIEYINDMCLFDDGYANYGDDLRPAHIVNILKGEDNESKL